MKALKKGGDGGDKAPGTQCRLVVQDAYGQIYNIYMYICSQSSFLFSKSKEIVKKGKREEEQKAFDDVCWYNDSRYSFILNSGDSSNFQTESRN